MKNKEENQLIWIIGILIAIIIIFPYLKNMNFAITNSDYICTNSNITLPDSNWNITGGNITYNDYGTTRIIIPGSTWWKMDLENSSTVYSSFPTMTDNETHKIYKFSANKDSGNTTIYFSNCFTLYTREVTTIKLNASSAEICRGLGGAYANDTCRCPNNSTWYDNSSSKVCGSVITTTTITISPTLWEKYGTAGIVLIIMSLLAAYLYWNGRKK
jgi:hypothetical protein